MVYINIGFFSSGLSRFHMRTLSEMRIFGKADWKGSSHLLLNAFSLITDAVYYKPPKNSRKCCSCSGFYGY